MKPEDAPLPKHETVTIRPPNFQTIELTIKGTAPYVQSRFHKKAEIMATQEQGALAKNKKKRVARDFKKDYEEAKHLSPEGWCGIPASCFRNGAISACRTIGYKMTHAKLAFFVLADGVDQDGVPLVKLIGKPEMHTAYARNDDGSVDIRARPMWKQWSANVRVRYDADMLSALDVVNLLHRVGLQVGIGEGRPDSKHSAGLGWGLFELIQDREVKRA